VRIATSFFRTVGNPMFKMIMKSHFHDLHITRTFTTSSRPLQSGKPRNENMTVDLRGRCESVFVSLEFEVISFAFAAITKTVYLGMIRPVQPAFLPPKSTDKQIHMTESHRPYDCLIKAAFYGGFQTCFALTGSAGVSA